MNLGLNSICRGSIADADESYIVRDFFLCSLNT